MVAKGMTYFDAIRNAGCLNTNTASLEQQNSHQLANGLHLTPNIATY